MSKLDMPKITVTFNELGITAIQRGDKGVVALLLRDSAEMAPFAVTSAAQIPEGLGTENADYIRRAFLGYVNPPKKVLVYTAPTEGDADLAAALQWAGTQDFDYICGPADCKPSEAAAIASWVKSERQNNGTKYKAVLPNQAADHEAIVNFAASGMAAGAVTYAAAAYCSRIAGLLAGTPMRISATYAPLPELSNVDRLTKEAQDEAVGAGKLILVWDGRKVKTGRAVNSLTTTTQGKLDSFKKIKLVEIMDLIRTDIRSTAEDDYIGKYANTYQNKLLLITAIRGYFMGLERDELVQPGYSVELDVDAIEQWLTARGTDTGSMTEQQIREADTGSYVFIKIRCKILDAIEDIIIDISI